MIEVRVKQKTVRTLKRKKIEKRGHRMGECLIDILDVDGFAMKMARQSLSFILFTR